MWAPMIVVVLAAMTIAGDWFLKLASDKDQAFTSPEFIAGALLYGLTAIGWVVVMREMTLGAIGVWFSIAVLLMLTALGVIVFKESLGAREILGIVLSIVALGLMSRFA